MKLIHPRDEFVGVWLGDFEPAAFSDMHPCPQGVFNSSSTEAQGQAAEFPRDFTASGTFVLVLSEAVLVIAIGESIAVKETVA